LLVVRHGWHQVSEILKARGDELYQKPAAAACQQQKGAYVKDGRSLYLASNWMNCVKKGSVSLVVPMEMALAMVATMERNLRKTSAMDYARWPGQAKGWPWRREAGPPWLPREDGIARSRRGEGGGGGHEQMNVSIGHKCMSNTRIQIRKGRKYI
jgi:hypothetical protein